MMMVMMMMIKRTSYKISPDNAWWTVFSIAAKPTESRVTWVRQKRGQNYYIISGWGHVPSYGSATGGQLRQHRHAVAAELASSCWRCDGSDDPALSQLKSLPLSPFLFFAVAWVCTSVYSTAVKVDPNFFASPNFSYDAFCAIPPGLDAPEQKENQTK